MLGHVDGGFARPLQVENRRILMGEIGVERIPRCRDFFPDPGDTPVDRRSLRDQDINVNHGRNLSSGSPPSVLGS